MQTPGILHRWLDSLDATGRWALLKLLTGAMRVGVSARLAKQAAANIGNQPVSAVEEIWHGLSPPYRPLFDWLAAGRAAAEQQRRRCLPAAMLANAIERAELDRSIRRTSAPNGNGTASACRSPRRAASGGCTAAPARTSRRRSPTSSRPSTSTACSTASCWCGATTRSRPFNDLQQRLNRKTVTPRMLKDHPAHVRLYDVLWLEGEDLRALPFDERRARLEAWMALKPRQRFDISPLVAFGDWASLARLREEMRADGIEGLMLKRGDSAYLAGRPKGPWFKWKRDPMLADCVMMYAQRGHGKRSSFYSDYTFGCWREAPDGGRELAPVGKAYFGFTDEELRWLDKWVRDHTTNRFGPVREVSPELVLEIAFDGVARSTRHKSGVALRFPRISRIRTDKPAAEADTVDTLLRLLPGTGRQHHYQGVMIDPLWPAHHLPARLGDGPLRLPLRLLHGRGHDVPAQGARCCRFEELERLVQRLRRAAASRSCA